MRGFKTEMQPFDLSEHAEESSGMDVIVTCLGDKGKRPRGKTQILKRTNRPPIPIFTHTAIQL